MSRLTDKYQSYPHYRGVSFDEQTFTANPTKTGSKSFTGEPVALMGTFVSDGANSPTIQTGVMPNQKYYEFEFDSTVTPTKNARLIYGNTSTSTAGGTGDIRRTMWDVTPFDRVLGVWMKMPSQFGIDNASLALHRWVYGSQALINVGPGKSNGLPALAFIHGTSELTSPGTPSVNFYTSYTNQSGNVINVEWDKWYFVSVRKIVVETGGAGGAGDVMTGTLEYQHYINGELVGTVSRSTWTKRSVSAIIFGNNAAPTGGGNFKMGVSSWFVAEWSDILQAGLREIYKYGAPIQAPVKYSDGTNFQDDISAPKVYFNNAWQDIYADRFDGTNWVPI